jgi:hypothetical protein
MVRRRRRRNVEVTNYEEKTYKILIKNHLYQCQTQKNMSVNLIILPFFLFISSTLLIFNEFDVKVL